MLFPAAALMPILSLTEMNFHTSRTMRCSRPYVKVPPAFAISIIPMPSISIPDRISDCLR